MSRSALDDPSALLLNSGSNTVQVNRQLQTLKGRGTVTLNGVTPVTVANSLVSATSIIAFTLKTVGGTVGAVPSIKTITPGTGFTVAGTAADTSIYNYQITQ